MYRTSCTILFCFLFLNICAQQKDTAIRPIKSIRLFNKKTLEGWEGNNAIWRVYKGVIMGGDEKTTQPRNEFLSTTSAYKNYELTLKFKVKGYKGFINSGVQFHSKRLQKPSHEMAGFQADIGEDCMGSLYDESRRDKYLASADQQKVIRKRRWNSYKIICTDNVIKLMINGKETITYNELDPSIPLEGKIALQIHGGGTLQVYFKHIRLKPVH